MLEILPSLLSADFANLARDIARVESGGARMLHFDVMDGHFVPNLSMGPPVLKSIRKVTKAHLDVHLMIEDPDRYIEAFVEAGANSISVHQETCRHLDRTIKAIQDHGAMAGVVLNPATPVAALEDILDRVDYVLLMSVNPGFGGQQFLPNVLQKVRRLDAWRRELGRDFPIEIDGGLTLDNVASAVRAGANWIVAGSSIFGAPEPGAAVRDMAERARDAISLRV